MWGMNYELLVQGTPSAILPQQVLSRSLPGYGLSGA